MNKIRIILLMVFLNSLPILFYLKYGIYQRLFSGTAMIVFMDVTIISLFYPKFQEWKCLRDLRKKGMAK